MEIDTFDELIINNEVIRSSDLKEYSNVKISYPGTSIYNLVEIGDRKFKLIDITRYFDKKYERKIRIDYEIRKNGMLIGQMAMIGIQTVLAIFFLFVIKNPFGVFKVQ